MLKSGDLVKCRGRPEYALLLGSENIRGLHVAWIVLWPDGVLSRETATHFLKVITPC